MWRFGWIWQVIQIICVRTALTGIYMWRFGWVWQVTDSMCEDKHLLVFRCGGVVGSGRLQILCMRTALTGI